MIRIRALGSLTVSRDGTVLAGAATQARRLAVLVLVARSGDRGIARERLLGLLWPDGEEQASRAALSQALHALRRDLGSDEVFLGVQTLRLNEALATCDVLEFEGALADEDWERAVEAYAGPFLEGFRLGGAAELDRWIEEERAHLALRHSEVLERLARGASGGGNATEAVRWWRRRAALDPLNARVTVDLMRALDAAGERAAAVQQARVYEALLAQELSLPPDAEVVRYAEALREGTAPAPARPAREAGTTGEPGKTGRTGRTGKTGGTDTTAPSSTGPGVPPAMTRRPRRWLAASLAGGALLLLAAFGAVVMRREPGRAPAVPVLAVGGITDYRGGQSDVAGPVADMLATNLARVPGIQVLSRMRILEVLDRRGGRTDSPADVAAATRLAGAAEMLEGGIHAIPDGRLLLELRRVDLATGSVRTAYRLEGSDVFDLVERATGEVAASLGRAGGALDPAAVSTRSLVAWRFYEEGLRGFARGDYQGSRGLFEAALREDSTFAMAAYYRMRAGGPMGIGPEPRETERLRALAAQASDRERLLILGTLAFSSFAPELRPIADTFVVRYPAELDAQFLAGFARLAHGEPAEALPYFRRVLEVDTTIGSGRGRCLACDAILQMAAAYHALDSLPRAETLTREWIRRDPTSAVAWAALAGVLTGMDRHEEAIAARRHATAKPYDAYDAVFPAAVRVRAGDFEAADRAVRALLADAPAYPAGWEAYWLLAISLRYQRRWDEAAELGRKYLAALTPAGRRDFGYLIRTLEALILLESGRAELAARAWDSLARNPDPRMSHGALTRHLTLQYALLTEAAFAAGDSAEVARAADSVVAWAGRSVNPRDRRLAEHARGLRALAQRDTARAVESFRQAIWSPTVGFTRTNFRLAELLMAVGRSEEAVPLLRSSLRGPLESANLYLTLTDAHELLGRAYEELGQVDSARVHRRYVEAALGTAGRRAGGR